jgi:cell surface protein SprA
MAQAADARSFSHVPRTNNDISIAQTGGFSTGALLAEHNGYMAVLHPNLFKHQLQLRWEILPFRPKHLSHSFHFSLPTLYWCALNQVTKPKRPDTLNLQPNWGNSSQEPLQPITQLAIDSVGLAATKQATPYQLKLDSLNLALSDTSIWKEQQPVLPRLEPILPATEPGYSPFFLSRRRIERSVTLDSSGSTIIISESIDGLPFRPTIQLPLETFQRLALDNTLQKNFRSLMDQETRFQEGDALEEVMGKITKLQIVIPGAEDSFFSTLFGPPTVSLQITGNIDINASYSIEENQNPTLIATNTNVRQDPNFDQQVRMNLTGKIGDKLSILADWDTERPFEYENQLKIQYEGYEDEIIQSIEAGNVSLPLTTRLIGSSQSLFGIKTRMQLAGLSLTAIASQKRGKSETLTLSGGSQESTLSKRAYDYDYERHFFLSNFFVTNWDQAFSQNEPLITIPIDAQGRQLSRIDLWISEQQTTQTAATRNAVALLNLGDRRYAEGLLETGFPFPDTLYYASDLDPNDPNFPDQSAQRLQEYRDPDFNLEGDGKEIVVGNFRQLVEGTDYLLDKRLGYITLLTQLDDIDALAASVEFATSGADPLKIGDFVLDNPDTEQRLILKLIKPPYLSSADSGSWILMLKNIYSLGARNIQEEGFELNVLYEQPGSTPPETPYLPTSPSITNQSGELRTLNTILGIDRFDASNNPLPDSRFDFINGLTIDRERGLLIFPYQRPFSSQIKDAVNGAGASIGSFDYSEIYENEKYVAERSGEKNRYVIKVKFQSEFQTTYNLGFNIVPGSVSITTSSGRLVEGSDYTVDYQLGTVNILRQDVLGSGSDISISYERNELLTIASKTILGARAEYDINPDFKIGSTFLQYSEEPLADKIRVGDEPVSNSIYGFDVRYKTKLRWLSKLVDAMPLISTKTPSEFSIDAEYAKVLPSHPSELDTDLDPNGVSYIDDFEGTKQIISLGREFNNWTLASPPLLDQGAPVSDRATQRALLSWYTYEQNDERNPSLAEVFPKRQGARDEQTLTPLVLDYFPKRRGPYNYSLDLKSSLYQNPDSAWGGMMRLLPQYARKLEQSNVEFIEFWLKVTPENTAAMDSGYLYIDLGSISEDVLPNGELNTEDGMPTSASDLANESTLYGRDEFGRYLKSSVTALKVNRILNRNPGDASLTEDIGLDGLNDQDEQLEFTTFKSSVELLTTDPELSADPEISADLANILNDLSGDNYLPPESNSSLYDKNNGPQGNSEPGTRVTTNLPDTEDLNQNNTADRSNNFYRYKIPIDAARLSDPDGPSGQFVVGGGVNTATVQRNGGFVLFRVPLKEFTESFGLPPGFNNITYTRIWISGFETSHNFQFASLDFIGSQWYKFPSADPDSLVSISAINLEENSSRYALPPGIERARDQIRADENILANEQSLVLNGRELTTSEPRAASRDFSFGSASLNLNTYQRLKMFIHAEYESSDTLMAFLRFGASETDNYYEYRIPVVASPPDYDVPSNTNSSEYAQARKILWPEENVMDIDLKALSAYKLSTPDTNGFIIRTIDTKNQVVIKGNPSLGNIRYFVLGMINPNLNTIDSAEVWFNELRVSGFDEEPGWAARANATLKLADFITLSAAVERQTADFHPVDVRLNPLASQNNTQNWSVATTVNMHKFLPAEDGWKIPITVEHTENSSIPKYSPRQTDIELDKQIEREVADTLASGATQAEADSYERMLRMEAQTLSVSNRVSIPTINKEKPSDFWLSRYTLDRTALNFNYNKTRSRSPAETFNETWSWQSGINYNLTLPGNSFYFEPLGFLGAVPLLEVYKDLKLYYLPQSYALNFSLNRQRAQSQPRNQEPLPFSSTFSSSRGVNFNYKLTETFDVKYSSQLLSSLNNYVVTESDSGVGIERSNSSVFNRVIKDIYRFELGNDRQFNQTIAFGWRPKMIKYMDWMNWTFSYSSQYIWTNPNPDRLNEQGNSAQNSTNLRIQSSFNVKEFFRKIGLEPASSRRTTSQNAIKGKEASDTTDSSPDLLAIALGGMEAFAGSLTKFDQFSFGFNQSNSLKNAGLAGGPGWFNFIPLGSSDSLRSPSLGYQLGLSSDIGSRVLAPLQFTDQFNQSNSVTMSTNWTPLTNLKINFSWQTSWSYGKQSVIDSTGRVSQITRNGSLTRSTIALSRAVDDFRNNLVVDGTLSTSDRLEVARIFEESFEPSGVGRFIGRTLGLGDVATELIPLPNWRISLTGLEKLPGFKSVAKSVSLEHAYTGTYTSSYTHPPSDSVRQIQASAITEQLSPLVGLNINWKIGITSSFNFNKSRDISLNPGNNTISQTRSNQFSATLNYQTRGFSLPLIGGRLSNSLNFAFTFAIADEEQQTFVFDSSQELPASGLTRISMEPRVSYDLSNRVNASFFWRYNQTKPKDSGSNIYETTKQEIGFNFRVSIGG